MIIRLNYIFINYSVFSQHSFTARQSTDSSMAHSLTGTAAAAAGSTPGSLGDRASAYQKHARNALHLAASGQIERGVGARPPSGASPALSRTASGGIMGAPPPKAATPGAPPPPKGAEAATPGAPPPPPQGHSSIANMSPQGRMSPHGGNYFY